MNDDLVKRITKYLESGGLFNPEYAIHDNVRDLLIDCRDAINKYDKEQMQIEAIQEEERKQYAMDNSQFGLGA